MLNLSEQNLLKQLALDDEKAFNEIFNRFSGKVFNLSRDFFPYKEDAEEIVQHVFIAIWENRKQIDTDKPLAPYILTIARHWIYNSLKKSVHRQTYIEYLKHNAEVHEVSTENEVYFNELNTLVDKLISQLPPKRKEIFLLNRINGLSYREIAEQLSITESTVNTQLTKAIDFIRKNIKLSYFLTAICNFF